MHLTYVAVIISYNQTKKNVTLKIYLNYLFRPTQNKMPGKYAHVKPGEFVTFKNGAKARKMSNGRFKIVSGPKNGPPRLKSIKRKSARRKSTKRKSIRRKSTKGKSIKRMSTKRKSSRKR